MKNNNKKYYNYLIIKFNIFIIIFILKFFAIFLLLFYYKFIILFFKYKLRKTQNNCFCKKNELQSRN